MTETDESFQAFLATGPPVGRAYVWGDSEPLAAISTAREPATALGDGLHGCRGSSCG
jgi:hypothetical protein